jgi:3-deoxy-D-arabino-heptulosonate 7-phosphate (DAHP) synthase
VAQCVTVWKGLVAQPHVAQGRRVEAIAELARQGLSQLRQQSLANRPSVNLRERPHRLDHCMRAMRMTAVPKALLWKRIKALELQA